MSRSDCIEWQGYRDPCGYGKRAWKGHMGRLAHRVAYEIANGPIPEGLQIDHLCRNRACVNPKHLEAVSVRENALRSESFAAVNARKTHCIHGHRFDEQNTMLRAGGKGRQCRTCQREAYRRFYAKYGKSKAAFDRTGPRGIA